MGTPKDDNKFKNTRILYVKYLYPLNCLQKFSFIVMNGFLGHNVVSIFIIFHLRLQVKSMLIINIEIT
jgi:hypothetical protein